ncbi:transmembrane protein 19-like [Saccostrea echinata]|uniref:transmembrane protein 19-like n=1 Tax=Saccostrea echinata TaxID=191078 RepID=UPI002A8320BF|nr:transmembrane protein 19-like [Saccostrea echinata]
MWFVLLGIVTPVSLICWLITIVYSYVYNDTVPVSPWRWMIAILAPVVIATWGLKKKSLDRTGVIAGLVVGFILTISNFCFFTSLLTFFVMGSKVTKFKAEQKRKMEHNYKEGGQRNWVQVLCNGGMAAVFALQYMFHVGCKEVIIDFSHHYSSSWLAMSVLGSLACCCGDTFSSELGAVFSRNTEPRLITTLAKVPRGTNGGVTVLGMAFSLVGGGLVGLGFYLTQIFLLRESFINNGPPQWPIVLVGTLMGFIGSSIDSFLGATFQYSGFDQKRKCVVEHSGQNVEYISGMELLDNHSVNLLTSLISALVTPKVAFEIWRLCS